MDEPTAVVKVGPNGELILDDPTALGVFSAVKDHNSAIAKRSCFHTMQLHSERIEYFRNRANLLGRTTDEVVIIIANVDTEIGGFVAEVLMPGQNWDEFRSRVAGSILLLSSSGERE